MFCMSDDEAMLEPQMIFGNADIVLARKLCLSNAVLMSKLAAKRA